MFESLNNQNPASKDFTPELKPVSPPTVGPLAPESSEEFISVMPARFRGNKFDRQVAASNSQELQIVQKKKKKLILILAITLGVIIIFGGLVVFYLWSKNYLQTPKNPTINQNQNNQTPSLNQSSELKLTADLIDLASSQIPQPKLVSAELTFPTGALDNGTIVELTSFVPTVDQIKDNVYQYLGGAFKLGPSIPQLKKSVNLKITYFDSLISGNWESDIKLSYLKEGIWMPLSAQLDSANNTVSISLDMIPSDTFALVIEKNKIQPTSKEAQIAPQIFSSLDKDNDGLTDLEEGVYQTDINNPDTDGDGQTDGLEVANLTDPLHVDGILSLSGLVKVYTNAQWSYSFFYPTSWLVKPLPETDLSQIMVVTNTGEFFEISVEDNFERLSPREWYLKRATDVDPSQVLETAINGQPAVWSPDRLNLYISKNNKIYILTYNLGLEQEANFKTTFKMIIRGFQFTDQSAEENMPAGSYRGNRPDGSLIKYPDSAAIYVIDNSTKRPIKTMEAFTRLGYKESQIVIIPKQEWYPDGEIIQ